MDPLHLLIVEDSEDDALMLLAEITRGGFEPAHARVDTAQGLDEALRKREWDIVLCDWRMPGFDAMEALEVVRARDLDVPFLIVSGSIGEETAVQALRAGAADFVLKDRLGRLVPAMRRELRDAAARRDRDRIERQFGAVFDNATDAIVLVDDEHRFVDANPAACRLFGIGRESLLGRTSLELGLADPTGATDARWSEFLRLGRQSGVVELWRPDGSPRALEYNAIAGVLPRVHLSILRDVTDRRNLEQLREKLAISDRMASIGMISAGITHEINNPLTYVEANVGYALERLSAMPEIGHLAEVRDAITEALQGISRIRATVDDVRKFVRGDREQPTEVDVNAAVTSSLNVAAHLIRERATLTKELGVIPRVSATEARLGQVFLNLFVNAAQAIPPGAPERYSVHVRTSVRGERVVVAVTDTGEGIAPEHLERLFTPFFTTKPAGVGTGLGLSICHDLVSSLGGRITVQSERGRGTTFCVELPALSTSPRSTSGRARILVIDDEPMVGSSLQRVLRREHHVSVVVDPEGALELLATERFDVILCDVLMPKMSGADLYVELVRRHPELADRFVFMSGSFDSAHTKAADDLRLPRLAKPFDIARLREVIAAVSRG